MSQLREKLFRLWFVVSPILLAIPLIKLGISLSENNTPSRFMGALVMNLLYFMVAFIYFMPQVEYDMKNIDKLDIAFEGMWWPIFLPVKIGKALFRASKRLAGWVWWGYET